MATRRTFIKNATLSSAGITIMSQLPFSSSAMNSILGANEQVNVAIIGVRSRAKALIAGVHAYKNAKIIYSCDVDEQVLEAHNVWCQNEIGYVPTNEKDFRKVLEDKNVDAIFIATPEHWHAPMAIMGLQAGKHVYVEKPCSHNLMENELLVAAQKKYGKVVQMGNQQRSAITSKQAVKDIKEGIIGKAFKGEAYYSNNRGSIGTGKVVPVPSTLDWDLWQGPAPREQFRDNIHPYNWHWFRTWGTGEVHNNGTHEIDICRWALGVDYPRKVSSFGGKFTYQDDWEFVDNQQVTYEFDNNRFITWNGHSRGYIQPSQPGRGTTIYGSEGVITLSRNGTKRYSLGGELLEERSEASQSETTNTVGGGGLDNMHVANFFNAIREDQKLNSPIEDAAKTTHLCHLGNIAQTVGRTLNINTANGRIIKDKDAMKQWGREYEKGWEPKL